ncbi:C-type mannose receptor 2-like [Poeciliopsis prolifica]|uniref:C-type mannose receptor 2-like n=1 Tax=Poeciliopsis prolifica TaxID=188132 RepID=UPI00241358BB|nr:C-type mannose receptor 2-like [Poeciliopsis prolifica]
MDKRLLFIFITGAQFSIAFAQTRQYYFVNVSLDWTSAQSACRRDYTDLATIETTADVDAVLNTMSNYTGKAWIGLYDELYNSWKWSLDDSTFYGDGEYTFRNWFPGSPNDLNGPQLCVRLFSVNSDSLSRWDDRQCSDVRMFVCYNGTVNGTLSFVLSNVSLNWTEAQMFCRKNYVDLASIRNQTENDLISALISTGDVWIGLYRDKLWSDGSLSLFRHWAEGQPSSASGVQCAATEFGSGRWYDEGCSQSLPFVCYKKIPPNAKGFRASEQNETSITLQWNKINNSTSYVLHFNGTETNITAPDGDGPVNHTVTSLTAGTRYTFTLFSVFENVRSSGVSIAAATGKEFSLRRLMIELDLLAKL